MSKGSGSGKGLSHFNAAGKAIMVDVSSKIDTNREAVATGKISMSAEAFEHVSRGEVEKGDVLGVARIAGIMAAKKVDDLIPLAHPLPISSVNISFQLNESEKSIAIKAEIGVSGKTGVEMEALTAVSITALTIYDMCKAVDKSMVIEDIRLLKKTGGKSGNYYRKNSE